MLAVIASRNVGKYNFPKYWQLKISEMIATIFMEILATNVSKYFLEITTNVNSLIFGAISDYIFQKIATVFFGNAGDEC